MVPTSLGVKVTPRECPASPLCFSDSTYQEELSPPQHAAALVLNMTQVEWGVMCTILLSDYFERRLKGFLYEMPKTLSSSGLFLTPNFSLTTQDHC
jgi:hypothetical protein